MIQLFFRTLFALLLTTALGNMAMAALPGSNALFDAPEFLPVDQAFIFSSRQQGNDVVLAWEIADGYYLYRDRIVVTAGGGATTTGPLHFNQTPKQKDDAAFGMVDTFTGKLVATSTLSLAVGQTDVPVQVSYQGCAEAGLCYPPQTREVLFVAPTSASVSPTTAPVDIDLDTESASGLSQFLSTAPTAAIVGVFFLLGLGLTFTPCVFPMIPILSSVVLAGKKHDHLHAFLLSLAYVLGMALTYAAAGVTTALLGAGANMQAAMQSPLVLVGFAMVFVALAMAMFGVYELQLPAAIRDRLSHRSQRISGGHLSSVFVIGALSALVVSPCISAPLAGALIYIGTTEDAILGGAALFALGMGMGVPLLAIGVFGNKLLPRAGAWMDKSKALFGVLLLAVAIWLVSRLVADNVALLLWAALFGLCGVQLGAFEPAHYGWQRLWKGVGILGFVYGVMLMIGAVAGAKDPLQPLDPFRFAGATHPVVERADNLNLVTSVQQLDQELARAATQGKPVMVDFWADWCISCKVMEKDVFGRTDVRTLTQQFHVIKADVTAGNGDAQALMGRFKLFGPPSLVFFAADGSERPDLQLVGEATPSQVITQLQRLLEAPTSPSGVVTRLPSPLPDEV